MPMAVSSEPHRATWANAAVVAEPAVGEGVGGLLGRRRRRPPSSPATGAASPARSSVASSAASTGAGVGRSATGVAGQRGRWRRRRSARRVAAITGGCGAVDAVDVEVGEDDRAAASPCTAGGTSSA